MDKEMSKILRNFTAAESGKTSSSATGKNQMKSILESLSKITAVEECGGMMPPMSPKSEGTPVSMNVSMNASGKENISDLIALLKNAGMEDSKPMKALMLPPVNDMHSGMDHMHDEMEPEGLEDQVDDMVDEWDNEPDEEYKDDNYMIHDLAGGINRPKKHYAKAQDGDNAMAVESSIKQKLWAALQEKKQVDQNNDGKNDWEDIKIARMKASGKIKGKKKD